MIFRSVRARSAVRSATSLGVATAGGAAGVDLIAPGRPFTHGGGATGCTGHPALGDATAQPSSSSREALDGPRVAWSPRATSSAASRTRTAFFQVSLARSAWDQPRSSSSAIRFG